MKSSLYEFKRDDAFRFANERGAKTRVKGSELNFYDCPYCHGANHGDKYTFSISLETGVFNCMRASCGAHGNMVTISKDFDFSLGDEVDEYFRQLKQFKRLVQVKADSKPRAIEYMNSRGISEEVTKRYGITSSPKNKDIIIFPFRDEKDQLQFVKYRNSTFKKGDSGNKEWCEANCKPILFGMDQCNPENKTLVMTEGQIDSLSCAEAGIENAVSVPTGKNGFTWVRYCWDFLTKYETLIVFGDHEHGEITLLEEMQLRFRHGAVKHVREEDYRDCKDANEILRKYGKEYLRQCINNAVAVPVSMVADMADVKDLDPFKIEKLKTGINDLDNLLHGGIPFGNVHILGGKRGDGKSTFGSQLIASALRQNYSCFIYSGELLNSNVKSWLDYQIAGPNNVIINYEPDNKTVKNWFVSNNNRAAISEWYRGRCYIYDGDSVQDDEREDLLKTVEEVIQQNGVRVILLDNLMTALDLSINRNTDKYEKQSQFVKKLALIARRYKVCIILVAHRRKSNGFDNGDSNDEISGSGDITNLAGVVLSYDRLSKKDYENNLGTDKDRKLIVAKERLFGNTNYEGIILHYDDYSKRIFGDNDNVNADYGWDSTKSANPFV